MNSLLDNIAIIYKRKEYILKLQEQVLPKEIYDINNLPNHFYLFSYGSNGFQQLAERLSFPNLQLTSDDIKNNSVAYKQNGYQRQFFGYSKSRQGSIATIEKVEGKDVSGLLLEIKKDNNDFVISRPTTKKINFQNLAKKEGFPNKYYLYHIYNKDNIPVYAFIRNPITNDGVYTTAVTIGYLKAICRMLRDRRILMNENLTKKYYIDIEYMAPVVPGITYPLGTITDTNSSPYTYKKIFNHNEID